jgi:hypothetical protein
LFQAAHEVGGALGVLDRVDLRPYQVQIAVFAQLLGLEGPGLFGLQRAMAFRAGGHGGDLVAGSSVLYLYITMIKKTI